MHVYVICHMWREVEGGGGRWREVEGVGRGHSMGSRQPDVLCARSTNQAYQSGRMGGDNMGSVEESKNLFQSPGEHP